MNIRFIAAIAAGLLCGKAAAIELNIENCTLQIGKETLKPTDVMTPWRAEHRVGKDRFHLHENEISKPKQEGDAGWTTKADDDRWLCWLTDDGDVAYLLGYQVDAEGRFTDYDSPPRLRRLNLKTGSWLPDLPLSDGGTDRGEPGGVIDVLAENGNVVVLTSLTKPRSDENERPTVVAYEVRCFKSDATKPVWSKVFPAVEDRPYTGGYLWGIPPPQYAASAIQHLAWVGENLLVCAEAMQPMLCLNGDTGSEIWRLERVWEFQRGFVGPSVYSHFIGRFGVENYDLKRMDIEEVRKTFDKQYNCALVAGPVVVPLNARRGGRSNHSIFLAVARGSAKSWAGYLSNCIVYEFDEDGKPVSMATLPQMVYGAQRSVCEGGVIWRCQNDTFVKVDAATSAPVVRMGGSGIDGISRVAWLRRLSYQEPEAWFITGKARDPVAFGDSHAFCLPAGGYIARQADPVFRFPISAVDLSTSLDTELLLKVPFTGKMPIPTTNYSSTTLLDGTQSYRTRMHREAAITALHISGGQLEIVLGTENWSASVTFDISKVLGRQPISRRKPTAEERLEVARARVKTLDPKSLDEMLRTASRGDDVAIIKALLEAGADPKNASENGWTALMTAAAYGTAEIVDVLIKAGSDVNARDGNCGGQTVLIWAVAGGKEPKAKIRSLLKAGADMNLTSENGFDALKAATRNNDIPAVELLEAERDKTVSNE